MSKKAKVAAFAGGTVACMAAVVGAVIAVNTLLDSKKTEEYTVSEPVHELVVDSDAGSVRIVATDADTISVRQTTHWVTDEPSPKRSIVDGVLRLEDADECRGGWTVCRCETDYRIEVPHELAVTVKADAGTVKVAGVTGNLTIESDAGTVQGTGLGSDRVKASTDAGNVKLTFTSAPSWVDAETDAGNVDIDLPRSEYALDLDTDAGGSSVEGVVQYDLSPRTVKASTDAGDIEIRGR
jgi:Putative adhesin